MVGAVQNNYLAIGGYYPRANVYGTQQGPVPPVTPVSPADPVVGRETAPISAPMPRPRLPEIRQGADPVEMSVRGRIQYLDPEQVEAFLIPKGTLLCLKRGTWHDVLYPVGKRKVNVLIGLPERIYHNDIVVKEVPDTKIKLIFD